MYLFLWLIDVFIRSLSHKQHNNYTYQQVIFIITLCSYNSYMFTGSMHVAYSYIEFISNNHKSEIPKIPIYYDYTICYDWRLMVIYNMYCTKIPCIPLILY